MAWSIFAVDLSQQSSVIETETADVRSAVWYECVGEFLVVILNLPGSEQWLLLLHPILHAELREEETDFSLRRLDRI